MTMMFYDMSRQYHAERPKTAAEQRRADMRLGMMTTLGVAVCNHPGISG